MEDGQKIHGTYPLTGLSEKEARSRLKEYGPNAISEKEKTSILKVLLSQFISPVIILLEVAGILSFLFKEWLDGIAILIVVLINALIGFFMEYQAERSMAALKKLAKVFAKVIRNGRLTEVPSEEIVPGDLIFVEAGDLIPADANILEQKQLQADESALTGESIPVEKQVGKMQKELPLAEQSSMLFKGTFITKGNGYAEVVTTGMKTQLGQIARMVQTAEQSATPLEKKLESFSKTLIWVCVGIIVLVFVVGIFQAKPLIETFEIAVALAVAAIPEGLPIVATLALAHGMLKMSKQNVIVKKLASVETLGGTNVICTDKTGTLTQNRIEASRIAIPGAEFEIGQIPENEAPADDKHALDHLILISALCNTASYHKEEDKEHEVGDPLEVGLLKFVKQAGKDIEKIRTQYAKVNELPFSSETHLMATQHKDGEHFYTAAKGAIEDILNVSRSYLSGTEIIPLSEEIRMEILNKADQLAKDGLRTIGFAYKHADTAEEDLLKNITYTGIIGLLDPPREDVFQAIDECKTAGIKVVMITGDHPATAKNIARQIGIVAEEDALVINGRNFPENFSFSSKEKVRWLSCSIFARANPAQKLALIQLHQEAGNIVGMTGDGVNDAPALKKADIGIAMGKRGTQVAQDVADMILKDDAFSSIVLAIKRGRIIFENIRKFVIFLLSCNISELMVVAMAAILNLHFALFPLQILFINLITDVLPALALGMSGGSELIMQNPPRNPKEPIIDKRHWTSIFTYSAVITAFVLGAVFFSHEFYHMKESWNRELCNNILFFTLILSQIWHVFNMASARVPFLKNEVVRNKYVWYATAICLLGTIGVYWIGPESRVLNIYRITLADWIIVSTFSLLSFAVNQMIKRLKIVD